MFGKTVWVALSAAVFAGGALWAAEPTITADSTTVTVSVPAGYAPGAKLVLAVAGADRGTEFVAWKTTRELAASVPTAGGDFTATFADLGFSDGNCTVRAFFQSEFEKLDYLVVDNANDYVDPGMLDTDVYGIELGYKPTGGGQYGKMICALNTDGKTGTHFRFEGAGSTTKFNFCADNTAGAYTYKAATLKTDGMNTVVARNNAITVNGTKLGDYRTGPMGLRGSLVRLNTLTPGTGTDLSLGWWYYLKIYGVDGRLLIDYIPAPRTADNVVGFYDQAEKRFVTPTGGGVFTAGTVVADSAFTDFAACTPAVDFVSRTLTLSVADNVATVTVPAGFATGEKLYLVSDEVDRGLDVQAWHDRAVLSESIPAAGGTFTCTLTSLCSFGANVLRVFAAEDCTRLASVTANEANDYNDTGVFDNFCYGIEYGYQPINGAGTYGKTFAAIGGTVRLERAGNGSNPQYNYCFYNAAYSAQVTISFSLDGNACNDIVFRNQTLTHNGASKGTAASAPVGNSGTEFRMNNRNFGANDRDSGKWYYLRLYARNGVKLVDYVPAKRADGTIGFVDQASRTFITPTGGGVYTSDNVEQGTVSRILRYTATTAYECTSAPVTAEWIGGATATDLGVAANWRCRNVLGEELPGVLPNRQVTAVTVSGTFAFDVPTAESVRWRSLKLENAVLGADVDWRGSFGGDLVDGFTLDLAGHTLTVDDLQGNGTITDTGTSGGVLRLDVPENAKAGNSGVLLTGSLRLLKTGAGEYRPTKQGANYTGGTVVEKGYVAMDSRAHPSGANASITISTNGVFDIAASSDSNGYVWTDCTFVLAGGMLENTGAATSVGCRTLGTVRLTENSKMHAQSIFGFLASGYSATLLDLGGKELELNASAGFHFYGTVIENGLLKITQGGWATFNGAAGTTVGSSTVDLDFGQSPRLDVEHDVRVRNLWMRANDAGEWVKGTNRIEICGTFTPYADYVHNYEMQNGSTIDLSVRSTVYPSVNPKKNTYKVRYAEGAKVTIDVHGRELSREVPTLVMSWNEEPTGVTFELDAQTRVRYLAKPMADGLHVMYRGSTVIYVR